jgi:DNA mismatch endonuclease (patch repair protein)
VDGGVDGVIFDGGDDVEPGLLKPQGETACTGEEVDRKRSPGRNQCAMSVPVCGRVRRFDDWWPSLPRAYDMRRAGRRALAMADTRTPEQRSRIMAAVRSKDTLPEVMLRKALHAAGVRGWRCHYRRVPGRPDIAWPGRRVAVFVDGAFWHGHASRHKPGRSGAYWDEKIAKNVARDRRDDAALEALGWRVLRLWDFEVRRDLGRSVDRVREILRD